MYDINTPSLDAAIDLSIMATKICYLPEEGRDRIISFMAEQQAAFTKSYRSGLYPLFEQYMDLMQDHGAPEELKIAAFLYLTRSSREIKREGNRHEAGTGERAVVMEGTLAGQASD
jgi:hypothetical protein